jgi:large subunit ribosomal protein L17
MKHRYAGTSLGRNSSWRKATVRDLARATLISQRICTTKARAKEARKLVEKLITMGKKGTLSHRRQAFSILCDHKLVSDLFTHTAPRFKNRNGGYTRVIPLAYRRGDNAEMVYLELTEIDQIMISKAKSQAAAKPKEIDVTPQETKEAKPVAEEKKPSKGLFKKSKPAAGGEKEKATGEKKPLGGLKKIFKSNRAS